MRHSSSRYTAQYPCIHLRHPRLLWASLRTVTGLLCQEHSSSKPSIQLFSLSFPFSLGAHLLASLGSHVFRPRWTRALLPTAPGCIPRMDSYCISPKTGLRGTWGPRCGYMYLRGSGEELLVRCDAVCLGMLPTLYYTQFHAGASTRVRALYMLGS